MALQVLVTFPGSMTLGEFEDRVQRISKMGCAIQLGTDLTHPIGELKVSKRSRQVHSEDVVTESLTEAEEALLDQGLKLTHESGEAPLLDAMTRAAAGRLKPNMSREIEEYFRKYPGQNSSQAASNLANKFVAHYKDINDAFLRIRNIINTLCSPTSPQRRLDRRGGRGDQAQIHVLI